MDISPGQDPLGGVSRRGNRVCVVGTSYYQAELVRHVIARRVYLPISAELILEDENPFDPGNSVAVVVDGRVVGHLSRANAAVFRSSWLGQQVKAGKRLTFEGAIIGGGQREDGLGKLGIRLFPRQWWLADGPAPLLNEWSTWVQRLGFAEAPECTPSTEIDGEVDAPTSRRWWMRR